MMSIEIVETWIKRLFRKDKSEGKTLKKNTIPQLRQRLNTGQEEYVFYDGNGDILFKGPVYQIEKGSGSRAFLKSGEKFVPLDKRVVATIRAQSIVGTEPVVVEACGLSKASISRITSDLQEGNPGKVVVKRILSRYGDLPTAKAVKYRISIQKKDELK